MELDINGKIINFLICNSVKYKTKFVFHLEVIILKIKDEEKLKEKYLNFIDTEDGKNWKDKWIKSMGSDMSGDFGDYLYDFYPELLA